jgi:putative MATE family efflux protein
MFAAEQQCVSAGPRINGLTPAHLHRTSKHVSALENPPLPPIDVPPLARDPVAKTIISFAWPSMLGVLAMMLTSVVDTYVARFFGEADQAALALIFPITFMMSSVTIGLMVGTVSLVARTRGTGNLATVARTSGQALLLCALVVVILTIVLALSYGPMFRAAGTPATVMPGIHAYMGVWLFGTLVMVFPTVANGVIRACGNAVAPSIVMVAIGALKIILTPVLMLGWGGVAAMGLRGAALSTIIAFGVGSAITLWLLVRSNLVTTRGLRVKLGDTWRKIALIGLPSSFTNVLMPICAFFANKLVLPLGAATIAGFGNALRLEALAMVPLFALSGVIGPFLGQNMGANRPDRMREGFSFCIKAALGYGVVIAAIMALFGPSLAKFFAASPEGIAPAIRYLWIVPLTFGFYGVLMCVSGAFNGLGNPRPNLVLYSSKALLFLLCVWLGAKLGGYTGICIGVALSNIGAGALAYGKYRHWLRSFGATQ